MPIAPGCGDQKQKENKTQAFLNRYSRGARPSPITVPIGPAFSSFTGSIKKNGAELFDDPIMRQAFAIVFPQATPNHSKDDSFIDETLLNWLSIAPQRSKDVCRLYHGLWWIVRPSTKITPGPEADFNISLLNIQPDDITSTALPLLKFHQAAMDQRQARM